MSQGDTKLENLNKLHSMKPPETTSSAVRTRFFTLRPGLTLLIALFMAMFIMSSAQARQSDFSKPIDVNADRSEFDEKAGVQLLIGNVEIIQGTMLIKADRIAISLDNNNQLSKIEGSGSPILFQQENEAGEQVTGQANSIEYDAINGSLVLTGNATLEQPRQRLQSDRIVFNSTEQKVSAEGGESGRVSIRIQPPAAKQ